MARAPVRCRRRGALRWHGACVLAVLATAWPADAGERVVVAHAPPDMVRIPAGPFWMGAPDSEAERRFLGDACLADYGPDLARLLCFDDSSARDSFDDARPFRTVLLGAYDIDRYEVTVASYRACVRAGACDPTPLLVGDQRYQLAANPVGNVTWHDAADYCAWAGKRLPTEAQWEKAARGRDGRRWPWGNHWREDGSNHGKLEDEAIGLLHGKLVQGWGQRSPEGVADDSDGARAAVPPGSMRWSDSPYGVFDLAGNVAEWVQDYYGAANGLRTGYEDLFAVEPVRLAPADGLNVRVARGGSWLQPRLQGLTYARTAERPGTRRPDLGFRCARDVDR